MLRIKGELKSREMKAADADNMFYDFGNEVKQKTMLAAQGRTVWNQDLIKHG